MIELRLFLFAEMGLDVPMALEDVHDLEARGDIAKENHVALIRKTADVGAKLGPGAANRTLERRHFMTLRAKLLHERFADGNTPAFVGDVS